MLNWFYTIRGKLLLGMLLAALLPLIIMSAVSFYTAENIIFQMQVDKLKVINDTKVKKIADMINEIDHRLQALQTNPTVLNNFIKISKNIHDRSSADYQKARDSLNAILQTIQRTSKFDDIYLEDSNSHIVYASDTGQAWKYLDKPLPYSLPWIPSKTQYGISYTPVFFNTLKDSFYDFLEKAPVYDDTGKIYGNVIFEVSLLPFYWIIQQTIGLGQSGESVLVERKENGNMLVLSPLRFNKQSELSTVLHTNLSDDPKSYIEFIDYRNMPAIGVWGQIPKINFSLLTLISRSEMFEEIDKLKYANAFIGAIATLGLILIALWLSYSITRPLQSLVNTTIGLREKNFNVSIENDLIESKDEIGTLASSFQAMISVLRDYYQSLQATNTELKSTQARLVTQEKLASLGALTAGVAHEIKNPLNFITNFALLSVDLVPYFSSVVEKTKPYLSTEESVELSENLEILKDNLKLINEQGLRINNIVTRMLSHARSEPGKMGSYDINELLNEAINLSYHGFKIQAPSFNIAIHKELGAAMPKLIIMGDDISRVFINLLNNSFYAIQQKIGGGLQEYSPAIWVKTQIVGESIEIHIRDNGIGIPLFIQERVFSPFFTTKPTGEGAGLGLSLSRSIIVDEHKGSIVFETVEGEYTDFIVTLPLKGPYDKEYQSMEP